MRPRKKGNMDFPPNLRERDGYFSWFNPMTGREMGIGRVSRSNAIRQAMDANAYVDSQRNSQLLDKLRSNRTIAGFVPRYLESLAKKKQLAHSTRYGRTRQIRTIEKELGHVVIGASQEAAADVTRQVSDWLKTYEDTGRLRMAKGLRSTLIDFFAEVAAAGWSAVNPIQVISLEAPEVGRARLTFDAFQAIHKVAGMRDPWVCRMLELAILTGQRRETIARMKFSDIWDGKLHVIPKKTENSTGMRLRIPLTLRLDCVGLTLGDVIARCRDQVVSPHLLHHTVHQGRGKPGMQIHPQTMASAFAECRDEAKIEVPPDMRPPSLHEIRSLAARLYDRQGYDPQVLLGHKKAETTAVYKDSRGAEWVDVAA